MVQGEDTGTSRRNRASNNFSTNSKTVSFATGRLQQNGKLAPPKLFLLPHSLSLSLPWNDLLLNNLRRTNPPIPPCSPPLFFFSFFSTLVQSLYRLFTFCQNPVWNKLFSRFFFWGGWSSSPFLLLQSFSNCSQS